MSLEHREPLCVFLCGDVMTGRGIDQILPHPSKPVLYESYVHDARDYVALAERLNGPICRPVDAAYIWGDALAELRARAVDVRVINLETSITTSDDAWPHKGIHYRMHPRNIDCISAAGIDCCCLGNNHVLDWGYRGLSDTLDALERASVAHPGTGRNAAAAAAPAAIDVPAKGRVVIFSIGSTSSGIPWEWAATDDRPGVNVLADLSPKTADRVAAQACRVRRTGDIVIVSVHWGGNWGYCIPREQIEFAHRLIDDGVDIVHGHSSHHVKAIEVYRDRLILYGCGDFLDDYEGIGGHEEFRNDLKLMYLVKMDAQDGRLVEARLVPMQIKRFRLTRAAPADAQWLCDLLNREGAAFGVGVRLENDNSMTLQLL